MKKIISYTSVKQPLPYNTYKRINTLEVYYNTRQLTLRNGAVPTFYCEGDLRKYVADIYGWKDVELIGENVYACL